MKILSNIVLLVSILGVGSLQDPAEKLKDGREWVEQTRGFLSVTFRGPPSRFEEQWDNLPIQSIRLARSRPKGYAEGFYPEYEITLSVATEESAKALGSFVLGPISYTGKSSVAEIGERESALAFGDYARLCLLAEEIDLFDAMKSYPQRFKEDPHTMLEIKLRSGETFTMSEWGFQASVGTWAFCCAIDKIWADRLNEAR